LVGRPRTDPAAAEGHHNLLLPGLPGRRLLLLLTVRKKVADERLSCVQTTSVGDPEAGQTPSSVRGVGAVVESTCRIRERAELVREVDGMAVVREKGGGCVTFVLRFDCSLRGSSL
jgi:hypothetical protein